MHQKTGQKVTSRFGKSVKEMPEPVVIKVLDIDQFDSVAESIKVLGGEEPVLALVNSQYATNAMNEARKVAGATLSDTRARKVAAEKVIADLGNLQALAAITDETERKAAYERLVTEEVARVRAAFDAAKQSGAPLPAGTESEADGQ